MPSLTADQNFKKASGCLAWLSNTSSRDCVKGHKLAKGSLASSSVNGFGTSLTSNTFFCWLLYLKRAIFKVTLYLCSWHWCQSQKHFFFFFWPVQHLDESWSKISETCAQFLLKGWVSKFSGHWNKPAVYFSSQRKTQCQVYFSIWALFTVSLQGTWRELETNAGIGNHTSHCFLMRWDFFSP